MVIGVFVNVNNLVSVVIGRCDAGKFSDSDMIFFLEDYKVQVMFNDMNIVCIIGSKNYELIIQSYFIYFKKL